MKSLLHRNKKAARQANQRRQAVLQRRPAGLAIRQENRSRYLDLFEFAPISYFMLDAQGYINAVNIAGARLLGVKREQLSRRAFASYIDSASVAQFKQQLNRAAIHTEPQIYDLQMRQHNGELRYVRVNAVPRVSAQGNIALHVMLSDITQQRLTEQKLQERKQYINTLFTHASGPIVVWDTSLQITMVNPAVERLTGYSSEEMVGQSVNLLFSAEENALLPPDTQCIINEQQLNSLAEITIHQVADSARFISWSSAPIYADDNRTILAIITQGLDITEHIQTEQDLRIAASAFEAQLGMMLIDLSGAVVRVNSAFSSLTGYSSAEAVGRPISALFESSQTGDDFFQALWKTVNHDHYWQGELHNHRHHSGSQPVLMTTITAVSGEDGQPTHYVGSFIDITAQKETEHVLQCRHELLEKQVEQTVAELNQLKEETEAVNTALKVMIRLRETEGLEAKKNLLSELQQEIMPFLARLKNTSRDARQIRLLSTLDANLQRLVTSYGCTMGISSLYRNLTPKEIQVASMVREGFSTKVIAATLSVSPETVSIHRKNIRKKLGLEAKGDNLRSYLITLAE